jgi:ribosomal protein S18 acetylase RimI-like enzyme
VVRFRGALVTEESARELLNEYFESRAATFPPGNGPYRVSLPTITDFISPAGAFVIVEHDGVDVGCGGVRSLGSSPQGLNRFEVKHVWVRPSTRGLGLGRALLNELERRAIELGAEELVLDTNASLEAAGALYRSSGYVEIPPYNDNPNATDWLRKSL